MGVYGTVVSSDFHNKSPLVTLGSEQCMCCYLKHCMKQSCSTEEKKTYKLQTNKRLVI